MEGGPPIFRQDFTCPALLERLIILPVRGYHPLWRNFPFASRCFRARPGPRSLATTNGVSFDVLSYGYLDVSIPRVCSLTLCIQAKVPRYEMEDRSLNRSSDYKPPSRRWVSPFRNLRVEGCSHLTEAYRSVPRLSSPLTAKAFPERPFDA